MLTVLRLSPPGPHCSTLVCVGFPPTEQCPSLLLCLISIPPILSCCLYNESSWISFKKKKTWSKNPQSQSPSPNKCGCSFWLSFLRCLNSCRKASTSLFICADLSWAQLIYEIYPKQSWLTSKGWVGFFSLHGNLMTGGQEGFGWLVFFCLYSIFMKIRSKHKYCEFPSRCKF